MRLSNGSSRAAERKKMRTRTAGRRFVERVKRDKSSLLAEREVSEKKSREFNPKSQKSRRRKRLLPTGWKRRLPIGWKRPLPAGWKRFTPAGNAETLPINARATGRTDRRRFIKRIERDKISLLAEGEASKKESREFA